MAQFQELYDVVTSAYRKNGYEITYHTFKIEESNGKFNVIINMDDPDVPNFFYILQDIKESVKKLGLEFVGDSYFYEKCNITLK